MDTPWQILLIRIFNFACMVLNVSRAQAVRTLTYTAQSLRTEEYYFFADQDVPVRAADYTTRSPGTAVVAAVYNRDTNTLVMDGAEDVPSRKFQFMEAGLYHGSVCLHDLSEFFENLKWQNDDCAPPLRLCIGVWGLHSKMFLDRNVEFMVRIVDSYDDVTELNLFNDEETWKDLTRVLPSFRETGLIRNIVPLGAPQPVEELRQPLDLGQLRPEPLDLGPEAVGPLGFANELVEELDSAPPVQVPFPPATYIENPSVIPLLYPGNNIWYEQID
jgi:hypothetical protein